jgi:very-short-patch-repair endonuclease
MSGSLVVYTRNGNMARRRPRRKSPPKSDTESKLEKAFYAEWTRQTTIKLEREYRFHPTREWRFDFALPERKLAVEVQGLGPGHQSREGMSRDYEKNNEAIRLGWQVVYIMGYQLTTSKIGDTIRYVRRLAGSEDVLRETSRPRDTWENLSGIDRLRSKLHRRAD